MPDDGDPSAWAKAMAELAAAGDRLAAMMRAARRGRCQRRLIDDARRGDGRLSQPCLRRSRHRFSCPAPAISSGSARPIPTRSTDARQSTRRHLPADRRARHGGGGHADGLPGTLDEELCAFRSDRGFARADATFEFSQCRAARGLHRRLAAKSNPEPACLWLRAVSDRWGEEREPRIAITRLDGSSSQRTARQAVEADPRHSGGPRRTHPRIRHPPRRRPGRGRASSTGSRRSTTARRAACRCNSITRVCSSLRTTGLLVEARMPPDCRLFLLVAHRSHVRHARLDQRA